MIFTEHGYLVGNSNYETGLSLAGTGLKKLGTIVIELFKAFACAAKFCQRRPEKKIFLKNLENIKKLTYVCIIKSITVDLYRSAERQALRRASNPPKIGTVLIPEI